MGEIEVPAAHYCGAQTQTVAVHFSMGNDDSQPEDIAPLLGGRGDMRGFTCGSGGSADRKRAVLSPTRLD